MLLRPAARRSGGFTLIELLVTMALVALLARLAAPAFSGWFANAKVRTVAEALQTGLRLAQAESVRQSRPVVFSLTNDTPNLLSSASANGSKWAVHTVPLVVGDTREFVRGGSLTDVASGVSITGPAAVCFNSIGRLATVAATGVAGATCTANLSQTYQITTTGADRPLRVLVALGGQVRMCDPARSFSSSPDGCP